MGMFQPVMSVFRAVNRSHEAFETLRKNYAIGSRCRLRWVRASWLCVCMIKSIYFYNVMISIQDIFIHIYIWVPHFLVASDHPEKKTPTVIKWFRMDHDYDELGEAQGLPSKMSWNAGEIKQWNTWRFPHHMLVSTLWAHTKRYRKNFTFGNSVWNFKSVFNLGLFQRLEVHSS